MVRKQVDPIWRPTARMRAEDPTLPEAVPPGPDNPLGNRAMYLGWSQYLIHGTNKPWGIGRRSSSGCIRMYPEDAEALFEAVAVGTKVTVVDQPVKLGWIEGELFMEAHPTQAQSDQLEALGRFDPLLPSSVVDQVLAAAGDAVGAPRLEPHPPGRGRAPRLPGAGHPLGFQAPPARPAPLAAPPPAAYAGGSMEARSGG